MIRAIAFATLSAAVVFSGASGAVAASKKARESYASTASAPVDPRDAYQAKRKPGAFLTWCDSDPSCNGWAEWAREVNAGKLKN